MKKTLLSLVLATFFIASNAEDIGIAAAYFGPIQGVGVGFYGHVGIGLPAGQTCNGSNMVVLLTTNLNR